MYSYKAADINEATSLGLTHLLHEGVREDSRVGTVLVAPTPVCVEYKNPRQRVLLSPTRDANHVFHLMEALWMLAGSNDLTFPVFFNSTYGQFSDDGATMWDAYGWRWREFFGYDQLEAIITELRANPTSRRCVLAMWNAWPHAGSFAQNVQRCSSMYNLRHHDLHVATHGGKAVPCNTHAYFAIRSDKLNMTVMNRSNDAVWGCYGANAVHFSLLLEYMAMRIGVPMGSYFQFTNNLHAYTDKFSVEKLRLIEHECDTVGVLPDTGPAIEPGFDDDLALFMSWALRVIQSDRDVALAMDVPPCVTAFMHSVVVPMFLFWVYRKWNDAYSSDICLRGIDAPDWRRACQEWVERRKK